MILDELDYEMSSNAHDPQSPESNPHRSRPVSVATSSAIELLPAMDPSSSASVEITNLRNSLIPLVEMEDEVITLLSGGVRVAGGKPGVYATSTHTRSGWQALVQPDSNWPSNDVPMNPLPMKAEQVLNLVAHELAENSEAVDDLWRHPAVGSLIRQRKLKLEESAGFFLDDIYRIAQLDYVPTIGMYIPLNVALFTLNANTAVV